MKVMHGGLPNLCVKTDMMLTQQKHMQRLLGTPITVPDTRIFLSFKSVAIIVPLFCMNFSKQETTHFAAKKQRRFFKEVSKKT